MADEEQKSKVEKEDEVEHGAATPGLAESTIEELLADAGLEPTNEDADIEMAAAPLTPDDVAEVLAEARDQVLRAQAEAQNTRRRAEKDVENARKFALERFCSELLPVVDNLERALGAADVEHEQVKPIAEGIELTLKSFINALEKFQLVQINPTGEPFDPQLHQAITMLPNPDMEPNTVMETMQKGFTLNGRLVRPAMVVVSKAPD